MRALLSGRPKCLDRPVLSSPSTVVCSRLEVSSSLSLLLLLLFEKPLARFDLRTPVSPEPHASPAYSPPPLRAPSSVAMASYQAAVDLKQAGNAWASLSFSCTRR